MTQALARPGSIFHLFEILLLNPQTDVLIPNGAYSPITQRSKDPRVIENALGRDLEVIKFFAHSEALRFGVKTLKNVLVEKKDGKGNFEAWVWRDYHILRDSSKPIKAILVRPDLKTFEELIRWKYIRKSEVFHEGEYYYVDISRKSTLWNETKVGIATLVKLLLRHKELTLEREQIIKKTGLVKFSNPFGRKTKGKVIYKESLEKNGHLKLSSKESRCVTFELMGEFREPKIAGSQRDLIKRLFLVNKSIEEVFLQLRLAILAYERNNNSYLDWEGKSSGKGSNAKDIQEVKIEGVWIRRTFWKRKLNEY